MAEENDKVFESVTDRTALDDFLTNAMAQEQEFIAEKQNAVLINLDEIAEEEAPVDPMAPQVVFPRANARPELYDYEVIPIPKRPAWDSSTTSEELNRMENESFLSWRRHLAHMEENAELDKKMTPFEKNLEMWRQLWRVIERSDILCQIVDARNPLLFRCKDLEDHVKGLGKQNMLIINKADFLSDRMREIWKDYFDSQNVPFVFFSAAASQVHIFTLTSSPPCFRCELVVFGSILLCLYQWGVVSGTRALNDAEYEIQNHYSSVLTKKPG